MFTFYAVPSGGKLIGTLEYLLNIWSDVVTRIFIEWSIREHFLWVEESWNLFSQVWIKLLRNIKKLFKESPI